MSKNGPKLTVRKGANILAKPVVIDVRGLFRALGKAVAHGAFGKWDQVGQDAVEVLSTTGLAAQPEELAFLLIRRSMMRALVDLVRDSVDVEGGAPEADSIPELDEELATTEISIDRMFLERPRSLPFVDIAVTALHRWLTLRNVENAKAQAIAHRLPSYFVFALHDEWRRDARRYDTILSAIQTPFVGASQREWAWSRYAAFLERSLDEPLFGEPYGLRQMYVPLRASYDEPDLTAARSLLPARDVRVAVVDLHAELEAWLDSGAPESAIRVLSGGPGSGKSSFARIFAAHVATTQRARTLFVPLHLIDSGRDFVSEIARFVRDEGVLTENPLDAPPSEPSLLIVLDGLDELAAQGKLGVETSHAFVREVEKTLERLNRTGVRVRVLFCGREVVVQDTASEFRRPRQILTLLPYHVDWRSDERAATAPSVTYKDPAGLLANDLRNTWWRTWGALTGRAYEALPAELARPDLAELTAQPLLNHLIALSVARGKLDFQAEVNLNAIYADLVAAVHERAYERGRPIAGIRDVSLADFLRVLEEIAIAAWHGDGRSATVHEIERHCQDSGITKLLAEVKEGAKAGVTRFLVAFFFRQHGRREIGDATFVFTHRSFGEYLAARRIVREMEKMLMQFERSLQGKEDWDEQDALRRWAQLCGPRAISDNIREFLSNELRLRQEAQLHALQQLLERLFSRVLRSGTPMELVHPQSFHAAAQQARNAEETLLVALNCCARITRRVSRIDHPNASAFGIWFRRTQGRGFAKEIVTRSLSFLDLRDTSLHATDLFGADLRHSDLTGCRADVANFACANMDGARLTNGSFLNANFRDAHLKNADLTWAQLGDADLRGTHLSGANLSDADLTGTDIRGTMLERTAS